MNRPFGQSVRYVLSAAVFICYATAPAIAADGPVPPCGGDGTVFAELGAPATVRVWRPDTLGAPWVPPTCLQWQVRDFAAIIAVAGRIGGITDKAQFLKRLTSTTAMKQIQYWSFSRKTWRSLFAEIDTLTGPDRKLTRQDIGIHEIRTGQDYFMWQKENSIASGMVLRGRFNHISQRRIVFEQINLSASHVLWAKILAPREYETVYFLEHESGDVWRYYSLTRFGAAERPLSEAPLASIINRSVAIYRYLASVPQDREPPAAP
jgi:hypothetical protein